MYIAIDLKSFYASAECVKRGLDPLTTNLVVADANRTEKTICLAVSPSLKSYGIPGRARLFEVVEKVREINIKRKAVLEKQKGTVSDFTGSSWKTQELAADPSLQLSYIIAPPSMGEYMKISTKIYDIYLRYIAPEDIFAYSIDEVFIDASAYLRTYGLSARELTMKLVLEVLKETGITATAGIGSNLYLAKIAMDVYAKHIPADKNGVRIAQLDERSYRELLWTHEPITDFWRVGPGYAKKLAQVGLYTMGDVARCSLGGPQDFHNEDLLYKLFGVNAELLIDHAWGWEPCTMADVKAYRPEQTSISSGQVLQCPYTEKQARIVVKEMTEDLALDLVSKGMVTDQLVLTVGYDIENITDPNRRKRYRGPLTTDHYGRKVPKHAHGTQNLTGHTSSSKELTEAVLTLFDRIINKDLLVRRFQLVANHIISEKEIPEKESYEQLDIFTYEKVSQEREAQSKAREKERKLQEAMLKIRKKYGGNSILKASNLQEGSTSQERHNQIGGHKK